jgi:lysophospholipase L1-like esterase
VAGNKLRLVELGLAPTVATEVARQITTGTGNVRRLIELGFTPKLAKLMAAAAMGSSVSARALCEVGMTGVLAKEFVAQVASGSTPVFTSFAVVGIGDSILAASQGTSSPATGAFNSLGYGSNVTVTNFGVSGETLATNLSRIQSGIADPYYVDTGPSVLYIEGGTNDFVAGTTGSALYALATQMITEAKNRFFRAVIQTIIPRAVGSYGWTAAMETERKAYNNLVAANSAGADVIADFRSDPLVGDNSGMETSNRTADGTHPNDAGANAIRPLMKAAIDSALAMQPRYKPQADLKIGAKSVITGVSGSTPITLGHSTWATTATSSDGTALTVNGATLNYAAFSTAGTKTITFVETPPAGLGLSARTSTTTVAVGSDAANYVRMTNLDTRLTERLAPGGGYTYETTTSVSNHNPQIQARYNKTLPAGIDGYAGYTSLSSTTFPIVGLSTLANPGGFSDYTYGFFMDAAAGGAYSVLGGGTNANLASAQGDTIRLRRAGTTVYAEVQRSGGTTWLLGATWSGASTAALTFVGQPGQSGAIGGFNGPFTTNNFA